MSEKALTNIQVRVWVCVCVCTCCKSLRNERNSLEGHKVVEKKNKQEPD